MSSFKLFLSDVKESFLDLWQCHVDFCHFIPGSEYQVAPNSGTFVTGIMAVGVSVIQLLASIIALTIIIFVIISSQGYYLLKLLFKLLGRNTAKVPDVLHQGGNAFRKWRNKNKKDAPKITPIDATVEDK